MGAAHQLSGAIGATLLGMADAGRVDTQLAWLGAPPVAQIFNLCLSIAAVRG